MAIVDDACFEKDNIVNCPLALETVIDLRDKTTFVRCMSGIDPDADELTFVFRLLREVTGRNGKAEKRSSGEEDRFCVPRGDIARMAPVTYPGRGAIADQYVSDKAPRAEIPSPSWGRP